MAHVDQTISAIGWLAIFPRCPAARSCASVSSTVASGGVMKTV